MKLIFGAPLPQELLSRLDQTTGRTNGRLELPIDSPRRLKEECLNELPTFAVADAPMGPEQHLPSPAPQACSSVRR